MIVTVEGGSWLTFDVEEVGLDKTQEGSMPY